MNPATLYRRELARVMKKREAQTKVSERDHRARMLLGIAGWSAGFEALCAAAAADGTIPQEELVPVVKRAVQMQGDPSIAGRRVRL